MRNTFDCPHCGEPVKEGKKSCPHCGSDALTGWKSEEDVAYESMDLPETYLDDEAYEDFLRREKPSSAESYSKVLAVFLILVGIGLVIFILTLLVL